jgi:hypothetical protein
MALKGSVQNLLLVGLVLVTFCRRTHALEAHEVLFLRAGPFSAMPQFGVTEIFNDNIFYYTDRRVSDFITVISPGVKLQLGRPERNTIGLAYTYDRLFYLDNHGLNTGQHLFDLRTQLEGQRLKLEGSDRIQFLSSPLGGIERVIVGSNVDRTVHDHAYTLSYQISEKTQAYMRGTYYSSDYQAGITLYDIDTVTGTAGFAYRAFPKTYLFGEGHYGWTGTTPNHPLRPSNPDLTFVGGFVGARGNFTEKLTGTVKAGYESREFDDGTSVPNSPIANAALTYRFSDNTRLTLGYSRLSNVSVQYGRRTYNADSLELRLAQALGSSRKWQATLSGNYSFYEYESSASASALEYDHLRASFNLAYRVQPWLTTSLQYDFESVMSEMRGVIDYDVNRVTLRVAIGF